MRTQLAHLLRVVHVSPQIVAPCQYGVSVLLSLPVLVLPFSLSLSLSLSLFLPSHLCASLHRYMHAAVSKPAVLLRALQHNMASLDAASMVGMSGPLLSLPADCHAASSGQIISMSRLQHEVCAPLAVT